ncbi:glycoside hydrolase [Sediminispirochaeta smaragdinae]|jgi:hypothetical protein|uniref:Glycoside hydrolase family 13 domain protein n=1 Tax=Sediminispirochaeta smaragdinae (strain DSM 11293 / JCM 15392 / SEBR 4228) TaxID=573413 RepID=E1R7W7_SEDSS|nr:glycoside hydrolase [Sediminispirochaeta smaragdinae]ADK82822.1 glycoside hydrolase family 13 domain protein [Sediminispirochaeta smaragdinae DSM 11293]
MKGNIFHALRLLFSFFLLLSPVLVSWAQEEATKGNDIDMALHVWLQELRSAESPKIYGDSIVFTYAPNRFSERQIRSVGIAFAHESYQTIHPFQRVVDTGKEEGAEETGVFFCLLPIPPGEEEVKYRLIIDGLWMVDPVSIATEREPSGLEVSVLPLPKGSVLSFKSPELNREGKVTFRYRASSGSRIYLAGSFNDWDPFMYRMAESRDIPGLFTITLPLPEGTHYYAFIRNGICVADPMNNRMASKSSGELVSVVRIGAKPSIASR